MANQEEWRKIAYEKWQGEQGNKSAKSTPAGKAGYEKYEAEQKRKQVQSGNKGCFPSYALVLTCVGWKPISNVNAGDLVLSYDGAKKKIEVSTVLMRRDHNPQRLWKLNFEDAGNQVITTCFHSFLTERGWVKTKDLVPGDKLESTVNMSHQDHRVVRSIEETQERAPVHNLITSGSHTFIVEGVIAHNFTLFRSLRTWAYSVFIDLILQSRFKRNTVDVRVAPEPKSI